MDLNLIFAVAAPVVVLVGLNLWLALNGERLTLLFPVTFGLETLGSRALVLGALVRDRPLVRAAANDEIFEQAA